MNNQKIKLRKLMSFYFFVFALGILIIAPTHIFPIPTFMYARFPHYLEMMEPFLGVSWPMSFEIYHDILYILAVIGTLNVLGIIFYPKFKRTAVVSSTIGLFLLSLMTIFFFFKFINVNVPTAITYGTYSVVLLIADILTFKALTKRIEA